MSFMVREYLEPDLEAILRISESVYGTRMGSYSLVSNLQESSMLKKYVVTNEQDHVIGYGLVKEQHNSPHLILKVEIIFQPEQEAVEMLFSEIIADIEIIGPYAIQARTIHDQIQSLQLYEKYGFHEDHRMMHAYLPLINKDLAPFTNTKDKLSSKEIVLSTLAEEMVSDANYFEKLQALHHLTWDDYPRESMLPPTTPGRDSQSLKSQRDRICTKDGICRYLHFQSQYEWTNGYSESKIRVAADL